ncbi:MAG: hypothetical protein GY772_30465 [bacterium]|nr:hypothetical protein [bacterium]
MAHELATGVPLSSAAAAAEPAAAPQMPAAAADAGATDVPPSVTREAWATFFGGEGSAGPRPEVQFPARDIRVSAAQQAAARAQPGVATAPPVAFAPTTPARPRPPLGTPARPPAAQPLAPRPLPRPAQPAAAMAKPPPPLDRRARTFPATFPCGNMQPPVSLQGQGRQGPHTVAGHRMPPAVLRRAQFSQGPATEGFRLKVGDIPPGTTANDIRSWIGRRGDDVGFSITDVHMATRAASGVQLVFITCEDPHDAVAVADWVYQWWFPVHPEVDARGYRYSPIEWARDR